MTRDGVGGGPVGRGMRGGSRLRRRRSSRVPVPATHALRAADRSGPGCRRTLRGRCQAMADLGRVLAVIFRWSSSRRGQRCSLRGVAVTGLPWVSSTAMAKRRSMVAQGGGDRGPGRQSIGGDGLAGEVAELVEQRGRDPGLAGAPGLAGVTGRNGFPGPGRWPSHGRRRRGHGPDGPLRRRLPVDPRSSARSVRFARRASRTQRTRAPYRPRRPR